MKKAILFLLLFGLFALDLSAQARSNSPTREMPADFKSDGCTLFPDGKYRDCCVRHDEAYYFGGSRKERSCADKELYKCVAAKKGWYHRAIMAPVMWVGVRIGGVSFLPTPFRWGFGKNKPKKNTTHKHNFNKTNTTK
jgi:hypothetical protein